MKEDRSPKQNQHLFRIEEGTEEGGMVYNHLMIITYTSLAYFKIFYMLIKRKVKFRYNSLFLTLFEVKHSQLLYLILSPFNVEKTLSDSTLLLCFETIEIYLYISAFVVLFLFGVTFF